MPMDFSFRHLLDRFGATGSMICAVHCALTPLLLAAIPSLGLSTWLGDGFERERPCVGAEIGPSLEGVGDGTGFGRPAQVAECHGLERQDFGVVAGGGQVDGAQPCDHVRVLAILPRSADP